MKSVRCMERYTPKRIKRNPIIAYDIETSPIKGDNTPDVKYWTMYGEGIEYAANIDSLRDLANLLRDTCLIPEHANARFIAWNANNFDVYFVAHACLLLDNITIQPFFSNSGSLRGVRIIRDREEDKPLSWMFLDGIAMTGSVGTPLKKFIRTFAPHLPKYDLDLANNEFDRDNKYHRDYAMRDSVGLYHAILKADQIAMDLSGFPLQPTIGNLGIKFFQTQIPDDVHVWKPPQKVTDAVRGSLLRGGFCWCQRQYMGKVWKYDLNQAYAAAMRDCNLPEGRCLHVREYQEGYAGIYRCTISNEHGCRVPFYCRDAEDGGAVFTNGEERRVWITNEEYDYLLRWGWDARIHDGYIWSGSFNMSVMVDKLQTLRLSDPNGPSGAIGTMAKYLGNNAYGKTLERLDGQEIIMSRTKPKGYHDYEPENPLMKYVYARPAQEQQRVYHQPHIGAFITAHVRVKVMEAAMQNQDIFIYADTDCVVFSQEPVGLTIDAKHYGDWKIEALGADMLFIGKKIYMDMDTAFIHAKGMRTKELTVCDMLAWYMGLPPEQTQVQRQSFLKTFEGVSMFLSRQRRGTDTERLKTVTLHDREYTPITLDSSG